MGERRHLAAGQEGGCMEVKGDEKNTQSKFLKLGGQFFSAVTRQGWRMNMHAQVHTRHTQTPTNNG